MTEVVLTMLLAATIDGYEAYRQQGLTDTAARAKAIEDNLARFRAGDAALKAAREGKLPV